MLAELLITASLQIGPFFEHDKDVLAIRPVVSEQSGEVDVLWPFFTFHDDWSRYFLFAHYQKGSDDSYQFDIMPFWFNGQDRSGGKYAGLFPIYGYHPHIMFVNDLEFALWPLWTRYSVFRRGVKDDRLVANTVLFPFFSWRSDGSYSIWPIYGISKKRESTHKYFFWPIFTWASYNKDRDTAGEGFSYMFWPFFGYVGREREVQHLILPPFFSFAKITPSVRSSCREKKSYYRIRSPWPFFEMENTPSTKNISFWPIYSKRENYDYSTWNLKSFVTRIGWKLYENYNDEEMRIFPFLVTRKDKSYFRFWPFYESQRVGYGEVVKSRVMSIFPIRHAPAIDRNFSKFWTLYESEEDPVCKYHSILWGLIRWRSVK